VDFGRAIVGIWLLHPSASDMRHASSSADDVLVNAQLCISSNKQLTRESKGLKTR
jgi:hypothetical protein